jgi:hypothetical protein
VEIIPIPVLKDVFSELSVDLIGAIDPPSSF